MTQTELRPAAPARPVGEAPPASTPVKWWATVGGLVVVIMIAVLTDWVTSPLFKAVPVGPTPVPTYMKIAIVFFEVTCILVALACLYFLVIKP